LKFTKPSLYNQWGDLFDKTANWQDFTFLRLEVERDRLTGSFTAMVSFMGLNLIWTVVYNEEHWEHMTERVDEFLKTITEREYVVTTKELDSSVPNENTANKEIQSNG
jgi:hypothetical protein